MTAPDVNRAPATRDRCPGLLVPSKGAQGIPTLAALLPEYRILPGDGDQLASASAVLAWGRKPSAERAALLARNAGLPVITVEDGFIRSVGTGDVDPPLSLVVDDLGIYYDSSCPSRLETLIAAPLSEAQSERARKLKALWCKERVSKYNAARCGGFQCNETAVLVADQTLGDASLQGAGPEHFAAMLEAAKREYPLARILLKVHPEVASGRKKGHFDLDAMRRDPRVRVLDRDVHPADLLPSVKAVYVMTSQIGFDALLWGVQVHTYGMPFYAGWGLTVDACPPPARRGLATLDQLAYATLVAYTRYVDPETGKPCEPETLISWMGLQRRMRSRFPRHLKAVGFSRWKRPLVHDFMWGSQVTIVDDIASVEPRSPVLSWGRKSDAALAAQGVDEHDVIRIEDGFLRSVGLGAGKTRPLSWVVDGLGIYYDATRPSRLEHLLAHEGFTDAIRTRAADLRNAICRAGITKYNLPGTCWQRPADAERVLLVTGQVEDDASIRYGAFRIHRNLDLLKAVREANPGAWIVYKPHPEVVAGTRKGQGDLGATQAWCNEIITDVPFHTLLDLVDEVHVLTSQSGFEALLRGIPVTTYGQPFYAGWGLTRDLGISDTVRARRNRTLTLDELVAGTLIMYPTYVSLVTQRFTTPERTLYELQHWNALQAPQENSGWLTLIRCWLQKALRMSLKSA